MDTYSIGGRFANGSVRLNIQIASHYEAVDVYQCLHGNTWLWSRQFVTRFEALLCIYKENTTLSLK